MIPPSRLRRPQWVAEYVAESMVQCATEYVAKRAAEHVAQYVAQYVVHYVGPNTRSGRRTCVLQPERADRQRWV